jgi:hypothetical protein
MRKLFSLVGIFATLALAICANVSAAFAAAPDRTGGNPLAYTRFQVTKDQAADQPAPGQPGPLAGSGNLVYHTGGRVQTGTHHTYAIYWGSSYSTNYKTLVNRYFGDVAADSGKTSNVYYSDTQYYQIISGVKTFISYSESFSGSWSDTALPSSSGCSSTAGGTTKCVSDTQIRAEVTKAINANHWPTGLGNEYFVLLGNGISTCLGSSCAFTQFCAYHSHYTLNSATVLYANQPYTGHNLGACGGGNYPNGDSAADSVLSVVSHEANETITDALGNAWYDAAGYENGDKCAWNFGTQLGGGTGTHYNQVINGHHYELQQEWSNSTSRCVLTGK